MQPIKDFVAGVATAVKSGVERCFKGKSKEVADDTFEQLSQQSPVASPKQQERLKEAQLEVHTEPNIPEGHDPEKVPFQPQEAVATVKGQTSEAESKQEAQGGPKPEERRRLSDKTIDVRLSRSEGREVTKNIDAAVKKIAENSRLRDPKEISEFCDQIRSSSEYVNGGVVEKDAIDRLLDNTFFSGVIHMTDEPSPSSESPTTESDSTFDDLDAIPDFEEVEGEKIAGQNLSRVLELGKFFTKELFDIADKEGKYKELNKKDLVLRDIQNKEDSNSYMLEFGNPTSSPVLEIINLELTLEDLRQFVTEYQPKFQAGM